MFALAEEGVAGAAGDTVEGAAFREIGGAQKGGGEDRLEFGDFRRAVAAGRGDGAPGFHEFFGQGGVVEIRDLPRGKGSEFRPWDALGGDGIQQQSGPIRAGGQGGDGGLFFLGGQGGVLCQEGGGWCR